MVGTGIEAPDYFSFFTMAAHDKNGQGIGKCQANPSDHHQSRHVTQGPVKNHEIETLFPHVTQQLSTFGEAVALVAHGSDRVPNGSELSDFKGKDCDAHRVLHIDNRFN